jgi:hypothetical protein
MRALAVALLTLLVLPVTAAGKGPNGPVRVLWNSTPENVRAGGTWDARLSLLQGPGGFDPGQRRPVIVVTDLGSGAERRVATSVDVPPNTFKAKLTFPRAGSYRLAVARFDPRDPERLAVGAPVEIAPGPTHSTDAWPWALGGAIALLVAGSWSIYRFRPVAARP